LPGAIDDFGISRGGGRTMELILWIVFFLVLGNILGVWKYLKK
jgi:hypothetical protein